MYNNEIFISIIILNFNGKELLPVVLPSLQNQTNKNFEIIIVDNGSSDNSLDYVRAQFPYVKIVENKINSFSKGNNVGISHAKGNYIFILNNDVEVDSKCIQSIIENITNSSDSVGMWATKVLNYNNRNIIDSTGFLIYPDGICRGRGRLEKDHKQFDTIQEVLMPSGCAAVYKKKMLDEIGLFDEDFEFYVEDSDLGLRARQAGWKCNYIPSAKIYHMFSMTLGKYSPKKAFNVERNRIWFLLKQFPISNLLVSPFFTLIRYFWQIFGIFNKQGIARKFSEEFSKKALTVILIQAWFRAFLGLGKMLKKRTEIIGSRKISLSEFNQLLREYKISAKEIALKEY